MNNRILGIVGSCLLILGIFMPIVSFMGLLNFSYFNMIQLAPGTFFTGILLLLIGIGSLILALTNRFKPLIATGVIALGLLILDFFRIRSGLSQGASGAGDAGDFGSRMADAVSIGWGFYLMVIGAIVLIVAGVMKSTVPVMNAGYGAPPPPPPPYTPGQ